MASNQEEMSKLNPAQESPKSTTYETLPEGLNSNTNAPLDGIDYEQRSLTTSMVPENKVPPPAYLRWLEVLFQTRIPGHAIQDEATAVAMDDFAKGPLGMSAAFLGPALLTLANQSAQLNCENNSNFEAGSDLNRRERI